MQNQNRIYTISIESKNKDIPFPKNEFKIKGELTVRELINLFENQYNIKKQPNSECIVNSQTFRGLILDRTIASQLGRTEYDTFKLDYVEQSNQQKPFPNEKQEKVSIKITLSVRQSVKQTDHSIQISPRSRVIELRDQFKIEGVVLELYLNTEDQKNILRFVNETLENCGVKDGSYIIARVKYSGGFVQC